jgi:hypothetical protein
MPSKQTVNCVIIIYGDAGTSTFVPAGTPRYDLLNTYLPERQVQVEIGTPTIQKPPQVNIGTPRMFTIGKPQIEMQVPGLVIPLSKQIKQEIDDHVGSANFSDLHGD